MNRMGCTVRGIGLCASMLVLIAIVSCPAPAFTQDAPQNPPPEGGEIPRQKENTMATAAVADEKWNLFFQATSVGQYHGKFRSPYEGINSLGNYPERDVSLTTTLYLGFRLDKNTQIYFDPEIAGGRGFSTVTGIANFPN